MFSYILFIYAGLEIHFDDKEYSTDENSTMGKISLSVSEAQEPFSMELIPTTVDVADTVYDLSNSLSLKEMKNTTAVSGEIFTCNSCEMDFYQRVGRLSM